MAYVRPSAEGRPNSLASRSVAGCRRNRQERKNRKHPNNRYRLPSWLTDITRKTVLLRSRFWSATADCPVQQMQSVKDDLMRVQPWFAPFLGLVLSLFGDQDLQAQYHPVQSMDRSARRGDPTYVSPAATYVPSGRRIDGGVSPTGSPAYKTHAARVGLLPPDYSTTGPDGFHPNPYSSGMLPSPELSPFEPRFVQHYTQDGLWHRISSSRNRQYYSRFEYLDTKVRHAKGFVGHRDAPSYKDVFLPNSGLDSALVNTFQGDAKFEDGVGVFPPVGDPGFNLFDARLADHAPHVDADGVRVVFGYRDAHDGGLIIDTWYNAENTSLFDAGQALTAREFLREESLVREVITSPSGFLTPIMPADGLQVLRRNLLNLSGIPVDDGTIRFFDDGTRVGGTAIPYDMEFKLRQTTESASTSLNVVNTPSLRRGPLQVSFMFGARYLYIDESFRFDGEDSGLAYDGESTGDAVFARAKLHSLPNFTDDDTNFTIDDAIFVEDMGGPGSGRAVRLDLVAEAAGTEHPGNYRAFLEHELRTHLTGPEVGLTYTLGGKKVRITGHSKFALLANFERLKLRGNNIGDANNIGDSVPTDGSAVADVDIFDSPIITPTTDNPFPNAFKETFRTTHVSPLFEQRFTAELPIFGHIPLLRRWDVLEDASFVAGWSVTWVGEVARPSQSILWRANPREGLFPSINLDRGPWWVMNWSFGVNIPF